MGILKLGSIAPLDVEIDSVRFPGWTLKLQWLPPKRLTDIREANTATKRKRGVETSVTDSRKVSEDMCKEMILGWTGFKAEYVAKMIPLDAGVRAQIEAFPGGCLPYSLEDLNTLVEATYSVEFLDEVVNICTNFEKMQTAREEAARKNSSGSQPTAGTLSGPEAASSVTP